MKGVQDIVQQNASKSPILAANWHSFDRKTKRLSFEKTIPLVKKEISSFSVNHTQSHQLWISQTCTNGNLNPGAPFVFVSVFAPKAKEKRNMSEAANQDRLSRTKEKLETIRKGLEQLNPSTSRTELETFRKGLEQLNPSTSRFDSNASPEEQVALLLIEQMDALQQQKDALQQQKDALQQQKDALFKQERNLETQLQNGRYFGKASEIFSEEDFEQKNMQDIRGMANKFMRASEHTAYDEEQALLVKALDEAIEPDTKSLATSEYSAFSRRTNEADNPNACIIKGALGHKGHQGCESPAVGPWWALVYRWMVGRVEKFDNHLWKIEAEEEPMEKEKLKNKLYKALIVMTNGERGGVRGMRSNERNVLHVPNPHYMYYDNGCNWVIFPIQRRKEMLEWDGKPYELAIFVGGRRVSAEEEDDNDNVTHRNVRKDTNSSISQVEAEGRLTQPLGRVFFSASSTDIDIKLCSAQDLKTVAQGLGEMGLALADLHTRDTGDPRILDLDETIQHEILPSKRNRAKKNHDDIVKGMKELCGRLESDGMTVPVPPPTNHFGEEGKHVLKVLIPQQHPPDPIVVAAKGANNFFRQRCMRLLACVV